MRYILPLLLSLFIAHTLLGQTFEQISTGPSYANQYYYDIDSKTGTTISSGDWHLAITAFGLKDAGININ